MKNTVFLYIRMLVLMGITFFTTRIILENLGVEDYGIYNVVGGLGHMLIFFRSSLSNVTQRYLNFSLGKNDIEDAKHVFSQHQTLYLAIAAIFVLLAETFGLWLIYNKMEIPPQRLNAAFWVFQFTVLSMVITLLSVVYDSAIIAHEDMKTFSFVGIFEGLAKLLAAYIIVIGPFDRLIFYAFLIMLISLAIRVFYTYYCKKHYEECSYSFVWQKKSIYEAFSMISWNTLGAAVYSINTQGINILLNMFFGPVVNAARGVAFHIDFAIDSFGKNFFTSVRPQLVKSYASKDYDYLNKLFFSSSKFSVYLLWLLSLPVMLCIDLILDIWLVDVPQYTNIFTNLVLVYSIINVLNNPIWSLILATGKLKWYIIIGSGVFLMAFPISYVCLKLGCSPVSVFVVSVIVRAIYIFVVLFIAKRYYPLPLGKYYKEVILPSVLVIAVSGISCYFISNALPETLSGRLLTCAITIAVITICILTFGVNKKEISLFKKIIFKKGKKKI